MPELRVNALVGLGAGQCFACQVIRFSPSNSFFRLHAHLCTRGASSTLFSISWLRLIELPRQCSDCIESCGRLLESACLILISPILFLIYHISFHYDRLLVRLQLHSLLAAIHGSNGSFLPSACPHGHLLDSNRSNPPAHISLPHPETVIWHLHLLVPRLHNHSPPQELAIALTTLILAIEVYEGYYIVRTDMAFWAMLIGALSAVTPHKGNLAEWADWLDEVVACSVPIGITLVLRLWLLIMQGVCLRELVALDDSREDAVFLEEKRRRVL